MCYLFNVILLFKFCSYSSVCLCARLRKGQAWGGRSPIVKMQGCLSSSIWCVRQEQILVWQRVFGTEILIFLPIQISLRVVHKQVNGYIVVKQTRGCNTVAVKSAFDDILSSLHMSPCWRVAISRALLYFTLFTITIENYEGLRAFSGIA